MRGRKDIAAPYHRLTFEFQRELITRTLREHGGNRTRAAAALGLGRTRLLRLIQQFRIEMANRGVSSRLVLSAETVRVIRERRHGGERICDIARNLGLAENTVGDAAARRRWMHVS